jgi:ketosteroid isomerase-like protein
MTQLHARSIEDEIRQTLDNFNRAWRERRFSELTQFLDEHVVMNGSGLKELLRGRDALIQSYVDFMTNSEVVEYSESNHSVDRWGDTAVAVYHWSMTWRQGGSSDSGSGQDMFVFQRRETRWIIVLRVLLF